MADAQLRFIIIGDAKSAQKAFADTATAAEQTEVKVSGFGKAFADLGSKVALGFAAFAAVKSVGGFLGGAIEEASSAEKAVSQLNTVLASTGGVAGVTADAAQDLATSLQSVTAFEDDTILGAENLLLTFTNIGKDVFPQATETVLDMSTALGTDLKESSIQVGKALNDPVKGITALTRVGVSFTDQQKDQIKAMVAVGDTAGAQQIILAELNREFGGQARAEVGTYAGQIKQLQNEYGNFKEAIGTAALPALTDFTAALNKGAHSPEFQQFIKDLGHDIQVVFADIRQVLSGQLPTHIFTEWALTVGKELFLVGDAFNKLLKAVSFGKLDIDGPLKGLRDSIIAHEADLQKDLDQHVAAPIADAFQGKSQDSPIAPPKLAAYGRGIMESYLLGLTGSDLSGAQGFIKDINTTLGDLFKDAEGETDPKKLGAANDVLAKGLQEVAAQGHITAETFYALTAIYGDQAINVAGLINQYGAMVAAQDRATASAKSLADEKERDAKITAELAQRLVPYKQAIDAATAAEEAHAQASADAAEAKQDELAAVGKAAAETARRDAAAVQAAQDVATAHAAANQAAEAAAQQELTDIQNRRKESADELYNSIVEGEQRALDAANHRVNALSAKAHKEDLGLLQQIAAAQDAGDTKKAAALRRQLEAQKKRRQGETELAAAEQAVAQDEFDEADAKAKKEVERQDAKAAKDEDAAKARLSAIQQEAKDQAAADAAAVKGAQDAATADAERYRKQQEGIQDEIDAIQRAAKEQAKKDAQAITDAQKVYDNQKIINDKIAIQLGGITHWEEVRAGHAQDTATATKDTYTTSKDLLPIAQALADAAEREAAARDSAAAAAAAQAALPRDTGTGGGARDTNINGPGAASGSSAKPLLQGASYGSPPAGYHLEYDIGGTPWFVPDGFHLEDFGKQQLPNAPIGDSPSTSTPTAGARGGPAYLRAGDGGAVTAPGGAVGWNITLNITAPYLTDVGNAAQQRQFAAQAGDAARREWDRIARGGGRAV